MAFAVLLTAACTTSLGPGFRIEQQAYELSHVPGTPAVLAVRASYRLRNVGIAPLTSLEVALPGPVALGRRNLRVRIDGREVVPHRPADLVARTIEIPFDPPWPQRERRELVLEYELAPPGPGHAGISVSGGAAHVRHYGWFPVLLRPDASFATGGNPPEKVRATIRVPSDFRILASGRAHGTKRRADFTEYRFDLREEDSAPFVVAGRYSEARFPTPQGEVVFWTFQPLERDAAAQAANRLAASFRAFEAAFGSLHSKPRAIYVVETYARLTPRATGADSPAGIGFPLGALVNQPAFALGVSSDTFLSLVEHELAHSWFGQTLRPRVEDSLLLSEGLAEYSTVVAAEARGGEAERRRHAALLLRWYDEARNLAVEKQIDALRPTDPWEQRIFAYNKGALFFIALEDEFGKENIRRGLGRLVHALRDRDDTTIYDLRSALEGETGRGLADFFRLWLYRTGLPDDFRSRYEVRPVEK